MSRGGKELFHANFISFVLELSRNQMPQQDWLQIEALQDRLKKLLFGEDAPAKVVTWRERNSLDLIVMAAPTEAAAQANLTITAAFTSAAGREALRWSELRPVTPPVPICVAVVIEAKLKALPTKAQLVRYNDKLTKTLTLEMESPITVDGRRSDDDCDRRSGKIWGRTTLRLLDRTGTGDRARFFAYDVKSEGLDDSDNVESSDDPARKATLTGTRSGSNRFARLDASLRRVLLSPVNAQAVSRVVEDTGWTSLSFRELIAAFSHQAQGGGLIVQLFANYADSTKALLDILDAASSAADDFCLDTRHTFDDLWKALKRSEFQHLRIHDAVRKFAYDSLQRSLLESLKMPPARLLTDIALPDHPNKFKFLADTFMSRAQPAMNFEFLVKSPGKENVRSVSIGVQVQGTIYRHFIRASHPVDPDGTGLSGLARLLDNPTPSNDSSRRWWRADFGKNTMLTSADNGEFKRFGKEAFLYTDVNVATMNYRELLSSIRHSLGAARKQISDSTEFREAVIEFLQGV